MSQLNTLFRRPRWLDRSAGWLAAFWGRPGPARLGISSLLVGMLTGVTAVVFSQTLEGILGLALGGVMGLTMPPTGEGPAHPIAYPARWWLVLLLPALGGLITGLILRLGVPDDRGEDGTDSMIGAFHWRDGLIRMREPLLKGLAAIVTIGTGGSAAQEGPTAAIGAGLGSWLARVVRLTPTERRLLMLAGASGGIGAIFRAPLGGALYAPEILYRTTAIETAALLPCAAASIIAFSTFALFVTPRPIFRVPELAFHGLYDLPIFVLLALACAGVGWLYVHTYHAMRERAFHRLPLPRMLKPALGGLLVGLIGLAVPQVLATGYGWVQWGAVGAAPGLLQPGERAFVPNLGWAWLLALALLKILATSLTLGSGGSGGTFGPSMFIGGTLGGAIGQVLDAAFPNWGIEPATYVLVGMGGFFAGVSKTPLASLVMVCEITGSYSLIVPLMLVCGLHLALSTRWALYEQQVPDPIDSPAHRGDFVVDVLEQIAVGQVPIRTQDLELVPRTLPFSRILRRVANSAETLFPVVDDEGRLCGVFTLRDLRMALLSMDSGPLIVADDIATRPVRTVTPADDLHTALRILTELNVDEVAVVRADDPTRLIGLLSRRALVGEYMERIETLRRPDRDGEAGGPGTAPAGVTTETVP